MMSCQQIQLNLTLFRQQFPVYSNSATYPDAQITLYWDMAINYISACECGDLSVNARTLAINLMTAHLLALSILVAAGQTPGLLQDATIDKVSVGLTPPPLPNQWQWWLDQTPYGQQLLALLQANAAGGWYYGGLPQTAAFRNFGGVFY